MSRCRIEQFRHNDIEDLERTLRKTTPRSPTMVIVDGVYSMAGDVASLPEIHELCSRYNACLTVDDAHALGVLGAQGRGTEEEFHLLGGVDVLTGTFSKSLASVGGWVAATAEVVEWLRYQARSMQFSAAIAPSALAAASAALDVLIAEPERVERLTENARYWRQRLTAIGFNTGASRTPIVPIIIGNTMRCITVGKALLDAGVYVNVVTYPAVEHDSALLRTSVIATHERQHLDQALSILERVGKERGII